MENNKFLSSGTKKFSLIASVIMLVFALVDLFLLIYFKPEAFNDLGSVLSTFPFTASLILMFASTIVYGIILINVFTDYKKQNKMLCTNGIINIVIVATSILIFFMLLVVVATGNYSSIYFYPVLFGGFAIWNVCYSVYCYKNKYKTAWFSVAYALLDILFVVFITLSIVALFNNNTAISTYIIILSIINLSIVVLFAIDLIINYVVHSPDYLITDEVIAIKSEEDRKKQENADRVNAKLRIMRGELPATPATPVANNASNVDDIEEKIKKLDDLLSKHIITEEEYKVKRQKLIDEM